MRDLLTQDQRVRGAMVLGFGSTAASVQRRVRALPMAPIERSGRNLQRRRIVERIEIDAPRLEMGAGMIEAFDAASAADAMNGSDAADAIACQPVLPVVEGDIVVTEEHVATARSRAQREVEY